MPKKGWRKVDGEWVAPESYEGLVAIADRLAELNPPSEQANSGLEAAVKPVQTAADRRNAVNRLAGWPVKG